MSIEQNKDVARRFGEEFIGKANTALADELIAPDYVNYMPGAPEPRRGIEAEKELLDAWRAGFPDYQFTIDQIVAEGDAVAARATFRGTHTGNFMGTPATGKSVTLPIHVFLRIRDGKIVENRPSFDQLSMLQQLGLVPAQASA